jgi:UV DNA damage endonuclease
MHKLRLGLVCISEVLKKNCNVSFKTMTRKSFSSMPRNKALDTLGFRILHNTVVVNKILQHLSTVGIYHYRLSSSMFPLITDSTLEIDLNTLPNIDAIRSNLKTAGALARHLGISVSCHPDQFNVLASYNPIVVERTIIELNHQSDVLDMMGFSQDLGSPMCLHLNCSPKFKVEDIFQYRQRFINNLERCNPGVQARLVLENEDKGFWNCDNLHTWFGDVRALVYDNLHDECNRSELPPDVYAHYFSLTWGRACPVFHWSEGVRKTAKHAKRASHLPDVIKQYADCIWEVELKDKDYAILDILEKYSKEII